MENTITVTAVLFWHFMCHYVAGSECMILSLQAYHVNVFPIKKAYVTSLTYLVRVTLFFSLHEAQNEF